MKPPLALLGLPEPDGAVPLVLVLGEGPCLLVAGALVAGEGLREPELARLSAEDAVRLTAGVVGQHGLQKVPSHVGLHYLLRAVEGEGVPAPEGWDAVLDAIPADVLTSGRLIDPLARQPQGPPEGPPDAGPLLEEEGELRFGVDPDHLSDALGPLLDALQPPGPDHAQINALVESLADAALDAGARLRWVFALEALTARALSAEDPETARCAHQTALALRAGWDGRAVPFVRGWVDLALRELAVMALQGQLGPR
jgi:hypothetical protein